MSGTDQTPLTVTVNGVSHQARVEPRQLLVQFLRETLGLTGTHVGCDTSQCGACVVLMDGVAVKSCTVLTAQADGSTIMTIEGLAPRATAAGTGAALHPLQIAFWERHGLQCGFCTPGMVIAAYDLLQHNPSPTEAEIRLALEGNFCRCTGYHNIVRAVQQAATLMQPASTAAGTR
jgi:aerobic carbon-monoxide dehydrogenase small subunit